ncbi:MAG: hypothetical protein A2167_02185 [Planctomycetes bacterium RBG_13_46_10]|nr:MAG: hypothetical protein A2167_02185 [Planctomycetes bacterium RBG_13_46_10]
MFTKTHILTAVVFVFSACQLQAGVIHSTWIGGTQGDWGEASNWSPAIVPDNTVWTTYVVSIDAYDYGIAVGIGQRYIIDQLVCRGDVTLYGPWYPVNLTLTEDGLVNYGDLYTANLDFTGDVKNTDGAELYLFDFFSAHGNLYNEPNATIEVTGRVMDIVDANIVNKGLICASSNGGLDADIEFLNSGRIELFGGEVSGDIFDNNSIGIIEGCGSLDSDQMLNQGIVYSVGGVLNIHSDGSIINTGVFGNKPLAILNISSHEGVDNQGTIEVNAGGGVAFDCNLVNEPNAVIKLLNGTLAATTITQKTGATFEGFGGITGNVVIDPNAVIKLTGPTNIVGDVEIKEGATLDISDGTVLVTGLTTCNGGTIKTFHGTIITQGGTSGGICRRIFVD